MQNSQLTQNSPSVKHQPATLETLPAATFRILFKNGCGLQERSIGLGQVERIARE